MPKEAAVLQDIDLSELIALIGLLAYTAVYKSNHRNVNYIFAVDAYRPKNFSMRDVKE